MKLQEFLNKAGTLLGVAEKGLPDESKLVALETLLKETESKLSAADAIVADLNSKLSESNAALVKSTEEISNLKAEVETTKASVEKLASAKALEITAAQGIPAIKNLPKGNPASTKADVSGLTGLAKVEALLKLESQNK